MTEQAKAFRAALAAHVAHTTPRQLEAAAPSCLLGMQAPRWRGVLKILAVGATLVVGLGLVALGALVL